MRRWASLVAMRRTAWMESMRNCVAVTRRAMLRAAFDCRLPCLDTISRMSIATSHRGSVFGSATADARQSCSIASAAFGEALADDGVDGGLDEGKGYPLSGSVALAVIDQAGIVGSDVRLEFADRRQEFPHVLIIGLTHSASQYRSLISSRARCLLPCQRYHLILLSASSMSRPA